MILSVFVILKKFLNWHNTKVYIKNRATGNHKGGSLPILEELTNLYDNIQANLYSLDRGPKCQLGHDEKHSYVAAH